MRYRNYFGLILKVLPIITLTPLRWSPNGWLMIAWHLKSTNRKVKSYLIFKCGRYLCTSKVRVKMFADNPEKGSCGICEWGPILRWFLLVMLWNVWTCREDACVSVQRKHREIAPQLDDCCGGTKTNKNVTSAPLKVNYKLLGRTD
jgi:hypothetical protein